MRMICVICGHLVAVAALLRPSPPPRAGAVRLAASSDDTFHRGTDLLKVSDKVTTRDIVNVLGRWGSYSDWNDASGRKGMLDDLRSGDFYDDDVKALATDFTQPMDFYICLLYTSPSPRDS